MIGLFDSGIGGLTVLRSLQKKLPQESFIYLGDTARLPYGTKSSDTVLKYAKQNIDFLISKGADTIISACHSASSALLENQLDYPVPILNVIEPACKEALTVTRNGQIGLLATQTTVSSGQYQKLIGGDAKLHAQASPLLVPLVETGWTDDPITDQIIERYTAFIKAADIDTLILGCTHFPLLSDSIQKIVGPKVELVDPGDILADTLLKKDLKPSENPKLKLYLTDNSSHFLKISQAILMNFDLDLSQVDL
mgnify:CR=1 FL=1